MHPSERFRPNSGRDSAERESKQDPWSRFARFEKAPPGGQSCRGALTPSVRPVLLELPFQLLDERSQPFRERLLDDGLVALPEPPSQNAQKLGLGERSRAVEAHAPVTSRDERHRFTLGRALAPHPNPHLSGSGYSDVNCLTHDRVSPKPFQNIWYFGPGGKRGWVPA
jgi:hypothetical protein